MLSLLFGISPCLIYHIVGVPCFSCGMTRAFMSLPDLSQAFAYHPLFFIVPFIPLMTLAKPRLRNISAIALIVLFIVVWIIRMIFMYPYQEPMVYNENSLRAFFMS